MTPARAPASGSAVQRHFLGARHPVLGPAGHWFDRRYGSSSDLDLGNLLVVVSGRRAGRLLLRQLAELAGRRLFFPPRIATLGRVAEVLQPPIIEVAHAIEELAVRRSVLLEAPDEEVRTAFGRRPAPDDRVAWTNLAEQCRAVDRQLAFGGLTVAQAVSTFEQRGVFGERQDEELSRWRALADLLEACEGELELRHRQSAWLHLRRAARAKFDRDLWDRPYEGVVLVALSELQRSVREVLTAVRLEVHSLIQADESEAGEHDAWGQPAGPEWLTTRHLPDEILVAEGPGEQAEVAARRVRELSHSRSAPEGLGGSSEGEEAGRIRDAADSDRRVVVAALEPTAARAVQDELTALGLPHHGVVGRAAVASEPFVVLRQLLAWSAGRELSELAVLLRLPVVEHWLRSEDSGAVWPRDVDLLFLVDDLRRRRPATRWRPTEGGDAGEMQAPTSEPSMEETLVPIDRALTDLLPRRPQATGAAAERLARAAQRLFTHEQAVDLGSETADALRFLGELLAAVPRIPEAERWTVEELFELLEHLAHEHEIDLAVERRADVSFESEGTPVREPQIEVVGWLEVSHDEARQVVLVGANEGLLPARRPSDAFLTGPVCDALGLVDDRARMVRDRYLLERLLVSRRRVVCVAGRTGPTGEPLLPSRLLLPAGGEALAQSLIDFYRRVDAPLSVQAAAGADLRYRVPPPDPRIDLPTPMPVTALRTYLQCPYRFYLRHVLRLKPYPEIGLELDGAQFGNLAHDVLHAWAADSASPVARGVEEIGASLVELLEEQARAAFGSSPSVAVRVQVEQLRQRLLHFARWQSETEEQGWRIDQEFLERRLVQPVLLPDGRRVEVVGRIDRLDRHQSSGVWRLVDYKTADRPQAPRSNHRRSDRWIDLQLPVYGRLLEGMLGSTGELGYVALSKSRQGESWLPADFNANELEDAWLCVEETLGAILDRRFWPPGDPPAYADGLEWIAGDQLPRADLLRSVGDGQPNGAGSG